MEMKNIGNELMQMRVFLLFRQTSFLSPAGALETKEKSGRPLRYANEGKWDRGGEGEGSRGNLRAPLYLSPSARIGQTNGGRHVSGFHLGGGGGAGGAGAEAAPVDADRRRRLVVAAADQRQFGHHQLLLAAAKTKQKTPKKKQKKNTLRFCVFGRTRHGVRNTTSTIYETVILWSDHSTVLDSRVVSSLALDAKVSPLHSKASRRRP